MVVRVQIVADLMLQILSYSTSSCSKLVVRVKIVADLMLQILINSSSSCSPSGGKSTNSCRYHIADCQLLYL